MRDLIIYFEKPLPFTIDTFSSHNLDNFDVVFWEKLTYEAKEDALLHAKYFITASYPITAEMINRSPNLKLIQKTGSGYDNIDIKVANEKGIIVANTPGINTNSVVELTIALILNLLRKVNFYDSLTKKGEWRMWEYRASNFELRGKTHGIIGMGNIGKKVSELSKSFGTEIIYYDVYRLPTELEKKMNIRYVSLDELMAKSDIISLHVPLMPTTYHLIGKEQLEKVKPTAIIVNVARGNIIDEGALYDALLCKRLLGAAIDSWSKEPVEPENPLLKLDNVIATPHIAGGSREALESVLKISLDNIARVKMSQEPLGVVHI
ncbi:2-hydroxyacid dehydrogenase [Ureibacillus sp. GCM10028918]|uniref:2-hydroxyacid dehydrogenase n=1 Tax=Ureibacillus sp. GCM10028918 TaxID=3273429 RepID=UPI0036F33D8E